MTAKPQRIQLRRTKGWRMPSNTVKIDRTTRWGNPYTIRGAKEAGYRGTDAELARMCVHAFRDHVAEHPEAFECLQILRGKNLACWCKPGEPCHGDVLLEIANA